MSSKNAKKQQELPIVKFFKLFFPGAEFAKIIETEMTPEFKKEMSAHLDKGWAGAEIDSKTYDEAKKLVDENDNVKLDLPTDEELEAFKKVVDYDEPILLTRSCSEYFDHIYTPAEIGQKASELAEAISEKDELEDELKSFSSSIKARIQEKAATINRVSKDLSRGKESRMQKCEWRFNTPIRNEKTLVRLDKNPEEVVRVVKMLPADKQLCIEDIAKANEEKERTLEEKKITPITNEPMDSEILTDAEKEKALGEAA